jgi:molybdopterin/thiamine biosynthesis adenylyltransferase
VISNLPYESGTRGGLNFKAVDDHSLRNWAQRHALTMRQAVGEVLRAGIFPECFERNFPSLSVQEQARLFDCAILVAGLGGLGGALAVLLARVGVGCFWLADGDVFTISNLNRQCLATRPFIGENKAMIGAAHLREINSALQVKALPEYLDKENLGEYLSRVNVVADGLDNLASRRELFAAAQKAGVPVVHGAVVGKFGQVTTILPGDPDSFTRIYAGSTEEVPMGRDILAPVVALVASLQAQEAIRVLLGQGPVYHGHMAHFDGDTGTLTMLPLEKVSSQQSAVSSQRL